MKKTWKELYNKKVRLIVDDIPFPKPKDGIFYAVDTTHIWLKIDGDLKPFLRTKIIRIDNKEKENEQN